MHATHGPTSAPPATAPAEIYLGRNGETHGPFTVEQFEALKATPEFATYTYVWDGRDPAADWKPIPKAVPAAPVAPPRRGPGAPPPDAQVAPAAQHAQAEQPLADVIPINRGSAQTQQARRAPLLRGYDVPGIEALCHDTRNVVSGKLTQVTDTGCELVCSAPGSSAPGFGSQSSVILNLLDPRSGQAMNVAARLGGMSRQDGRWSLKVLWDACPELLVRQLEKAA